MIDNIQDNYGIIIYDKRKLPINLEFMDSKKVMARDPQYQVSREEIVVNDSDFGKKLDLKVSYPLHPHIFDVRIPHPYTGFKPMPGVRISELTSYNGLGHRSPTLGVKKEGVVRIAILGGSTAANGPSNDETIIGLIAQNLTEMGYEVEFINAAVPSYISNQELSVFIHDLIDLQTDLVITFDGNNDVEHILTYNGRVGWPTFRWRNIYYPFIPPDRDLSGDKFNQVVLNYLGNIEKIAKISKAYDIRYLAVIQPLNGFNPETCDPNNKITDKQSFFCIIEEKFREWDSNQKDGAKYISLASHLSNEKNAFQDHCHINQWARKKISDRILNVILEEKLLEKDPKKT
ncbi:hypothetical protein ACFLRF_01140 [Candidatus Altiarchaeota archaeon]